MILSSKWITWPPSPEIAKQRIWPSLIEIMSTALALGDANLTSQSVDLPAASSGPVEIVVRSNGFPSACQAWARGLARSQASLAVIAAGFPVLPAVQLTFA